LNTLFILIEKKCNNKRKNKHKTQYNVKKPPTENCVIIHDSI